jgi:hypothetical protein
MRLSPASHRAVAEIKQLQEAVKIGDESGARIPAAEVFTEVRRMIAKRLPTQNPAGAASQVGADE